MNQESTDAVIEQVELGLAVSPVKTQGIAVGETSALTLRPYQEEAIAATLEAFETFQRVMIVAAVAAGKTILASEMVRELAHRGRVVFIAHREELLTQTIEKMRLVLGDDISIGMVKAEYDDYDADIVVASIQTIQNENRLNRIIGSGPIGLVITDECHHISSPSYMTALDRLGCFEADGPKLLGITATPDRADGVGLGAVFESIAYEVGIFDLIDQGYLVDIEAKEVAIDVDFSKIRTTAGDYNARDSGRELMQSHAPEVIAEAMKEHAAGRRSLVFVPTVEMAHATAEAINEVGIRARSISGKTPSDERHWITNALHRGEIDAAVNVGVYTEGTDIPPVDTIVIAKPTKSRSLFVQSIGRGLRLFPGKEKALILDLVGSTGQHRLQTISSLFGLDPKKLKKKTVRQVVEEERAEREKAQTGKVVVRDVQSLRGRVMHWTTTSNGQYVLPAPPGLLILRYGGVTKVGTPGWDVWYSVGQSAPELKHSGLPLDYAQGVAEDIARETVGKDGNVLTKPEAPWRSDPVTEKQLARCRWLGIPTSGIRTKGEASDAMNGAEAMQKLGQIENKKKREGMRLWERKK